MSQTLSKPMELGRLLSKTIGSVVVAQEEMDRYTLERKKKYEELHAGKLALPPLWYIFSKVEVELEMSATVKNSETTVFGMDNPSGIYCRTLDPMMVSLFGYEASSGLRVRVRMSPQGTVPIKTVSIEKD